MAKFGAGLQPVDLAIVAKELLDWIFYVEQKQYCFPGGDFFPDYWRDVAAGLKRLRAVIPADVDVLDCGPMERGNLRKLAKLLVELEEDWLEPSTEKLHQCTLPAPEVKRIRWFWDFFKAFHPKSPTKEAGHPAAGPKARRASKTCAEYNVEARDYLKKHPEAGPRELIRALGCGAKTLYKLPAFIAVREQREKGRKPKKPKAVSLTDEMAAVVQSRDNELARLTKEQNRERWTNKVHPRERM